MLSAKEEGPWLLRFTSLPVRCLSFDDELCDNDLSYDDTCFEWLELREVDDSFRLLGWRRALPLVPLDWLVDWVS